MRKAFTFLFLLSFPMLVRATDPGAAVQAARDQIAAKRYAAAVDTLRSALGEVEQLGPDERGKAAAAVHFYSAVALSGLKEDADATAHLKEFFALVPNARLATPDKYDGRFVKLFRSTQLLDESAPREANAQFRFDNFYPGFTAGGPGVTAVEEQTRIWPAAITLLASIREKQQWESTIPSADRERFVAGFWARRDPAPETPENEFRDTFVRRVMFADQAFGSVAERGSMTDRGRVFVLLGVPSSVHRRPLTPLDRVQVVESNVQLNGLIEQWVYANDLLPVRIAKKYVGYRFVTQKGIGDNVLQREEPYAFQALILAMNPNDRKK